MDLPTDYFDRAGINRFLKTGEFPIACPHRVERYKNTSPAPTIEVAIPDKFPELDIVSIGKPDYTKSGMEGDVLFVGDKVYKRYNDPDAALVEYRKIEVLRALVTLHEAPPETLHEVYPGVITDLFLLPTRFVIGTAHSAANGATRENEVFIESNFIEPTPCSTQLLKNLYKLNKLRKFGIYITHNDIHKGNVLGDKLIDFGCMCVGFNTCGGEPGGARGLSIYRTLGFEIGRTRERCTEFNDFFDAMVLVFGEEFTNLINHHLFDGEIVIPVDCNKRATIRLLPDIYYKHHGIELEFEKLKVFF